MAPSAQMVIVGSGVLGLAHAAEALERGFQVTVIERDHRAIGASVRNFGHICITAQGGAAYDLARSGRSMWLERASQAGFWLTESGTVVVATTAGEASLLSQFHETRKESSSWVSSSDLATTFGIHNRSDYTQALHLHEDIRVNPREVVPKVVSWLECEGVQFQWGTLVTGVDDHRVLTSRGQFEADRIVVTVNHDLDHLYPEASEQFDLQRCALQMLRVEPATKQHLPSAVLSGTSMLRYEGFEGLPARQDVYDEIDSERSILLASACNLMVTQLPDGSLLLGDTHVYGNTVGPFMSGEWAEMLLTAGAELLGFEFSRISEYWQGTYLSGRLGGLQLDSPSPHASPSPESPYGRGQLLHHRPLPHIDVVSALSGIGMTTAFGLADWVSRKW